LPAKLRKNYAPSSGHDRSAFTGDLQGSCLRLIERCRNVVKFLRSNPVPWPGYDSGPIRKNPRKYPNCLNDTRTVPRDQSAVDQMNSSDSNTPSNDRAALRSRARANSQPSLNRISRTGSRSRTFSIDRPTRVSGRLIDRRPSRTRRCREDLDLLLRDPRQIDLHTSPPTHTAKSNRTTRGESRRGIVIPE